MSARRLLEVMLAVIGDAVPAMVRCKTLAAMEGRTMAVVAMIVVVRAASIIAPVVSVIVMPVRAAIIVTLLDTVAIVIVIVIVLLLGCGERGTRGQQGHNHERSDEAFHLRTPASQERPVDNPTVGIFS
ncbi:hypothetical protein XVE_3348 [Xanthomonas vesicatoria ATCC 35937]|uniref:Uncharacterized protein n=1 Tax=Xanthomonas vesicatoria ATCC 35937 TaxID=925775 RepID=F0BGH2_9XANT|nr:hypothetical protein XVE_3348 [Xanthomonas vesicatoria ATCC 35937]